MHKDQLAQKSWLASFSLQFQCFIKTIVQIYMPEISFLKSGLWHFAQVRNVSSWDQPKGNKWAFQRRLPWPHACPHGGAWLSEPHGKAPTALTSAPRPRWWDGPACPGGLCTPQRLSTGAKTKISPWLLNSAIFTSGGWHPTPSGSNSSFPLPFKHPTAETLGLSWKSQENSVTMMWVCNHFSLSSFIWLHERKNFESGVNTSSIDSVMIR